MEEKNISQDGSALQSTWLRASGLCSLALAALIAGHFIFLISYFEPAISTPDANGYFAQARLIATGHRTSFETESVLQYVGVHWLETGDNSYFCRYPPGFPAILAVVFRILGPEATLLVNPLMASLSLLALFLICSLWIGRWWGLLAAALMAFNPVANQHALASDSHTATMFVLIWALLFLAWWARTYSPGWALAAGLLIGLIPAIRYPESLSALAFGIFVLLNLKGNRAAQRSLVAGMIGLAIPIGALCIHNYLAFGAFWKTGYSLTNEQTGFGWNYFTSYGPRYLQKLLGEGCGLLSGLGAAGLAVLCARRDTRKQGVLLAALAVPVTLLYMSYYWPPDRASMRFLLPTFFVYQIAGVWLLQIACSSRPGAARAGAAVVLFLTVIWGLPQSVQSLQRLEFPNAALARVTRAVQNHAEPGSIVIAGNLFLQHLDFLGRWRLADESILRRHGPGPPGAFSRDEDAPGPRQQNKMAGRRERYQDLEGEELFDTFSRDIRQWAGVQRKVYWICNERQINLSERYLGRGEKLAILEEIELPERKMPEPDESGKFRGAPFGRDRRPGAQLLRARGRGGAMQRRFDIILSGEPLFLVEWTKEKP